MGAERAHDRVVKRLFTVEQVFLDGAAVFNFVKEEALVIGLLGGFLAAVPGGRDDERYRVVCPVRGGLVLIVGHSLARSAARALSRSVV